MLFPNVSLISPNPDKPESAKVTQAIEQALK